jgi:hypothetical protein
MTLRSPFEIFQCRKFAVYSMPGNVETVRINCIGQLGLGLLPPLGPQPIRVRVREAQPLVLLPPLATALLALA